MKFIPIQNKLKFENIQYFFNMIRVNPHIAVVSILTLPMILHLTCKIRMREITGCANTGTKTVNVKVYSLIMGTGASSLAHTELHSASPSGGGRFITQNVVV